MVDLKGTMECWICGQDTPHYHPPELVEAARAVWVGGPRLLLRYIGQGELHGRWLRIVNALENGGMLALGAGERVTRILWAKDFDWTDPVVLRRDQNS